MELRGRGIRKASYGLEDDLAWRYVSQDVYEGIHVLGQLVLCLVHSLFVWKWTCYLPRVSVGSFDLTEDNMEEVSRDVGQDKVDFSFMERIISAGILRCLIICSIAFSTLISASMSIHFWTAVYSGSFLALVWAVVSAKNLPASLAFSFYRTRVRSYWLCLSLTH